MDTVSFRQKIHLMRNMLSVINTYLKRQDPTDSDDKEFLDAARSSAKKISDTLEEFSKMMEPGVL